MPLPLPAPGLRRLFVCLLPHEPARHAIARLRSEWHWPAHRCWTESERLHVTVADPLYYADAELARLREGLRQLRFGPFTLRLQRARVGGSHLVLQAAPSPAFKALQAEVADLARRAHAPFWHRPGAHVTLSRDALGVAPPRLPQAIDWPVSEVCLVWLQLTPEVGRRHYEVLATCGASEALVAPAQLSFGFQ